MRTLLDKEYLLPFWKSIILLTLPVELQPSSRREDTALPRIAELDEMQSNVSLLSTDENETQVKAVDTETEQPAEPDSESLTIEATEKPEADFVEKVENPETSDSTLQQQTNGSASDTLRRSKRQPKPPLWHYH